MFKAIARTLTVALCFVAGAAAYAEDRLNSSADYAYIMDADTGLELYSKNGHEPFIPASMTKIMTAYMVFDRIRNGRLEWDEEIIISENAWRKGGAASGGSTMFLEPGSKVSVGDLVRGVIIQSGNDACIALAEGMSGSEEAFAAEMTARAKEMGLETARFKNATGLPEEGHVISAADLAKLAFATINDFPEYYGLYKESSFTWNGIQQPNRNPLLGDIEGADGLKTGHLEESGYGLVGSAILDGERRIIVLNGLDSLQDRATESRRVMRAAFRDFKAASLVKAETIVAEADVWMGVEDTVPLKAAADLSHVFHANDLRRLDIYVQYEGPLRAPVTAGEVVGRLIAEAPGMESLSVPLVSAKSVAKKGLLARALFSLGLGG